MSTGGNRVVEGGEGVGLAIGVEAGDGPGSGVIGEGTGEEGLIEEFEDGGGHAGGVGRRDEQAAVFGQERSGAGNVGRDARETGDEGRSQGRRAGGGGCRVDVEGHDPPEGGFEGGGGGEGEASGQFEPLGSAAEAGLSGTEAADEELDVAAGFDDAEDGVEEGLEPRGRAEATDRADDRQPAGGERVVLGPCTDRGVDSGRNDPKKRFGKEGTIDQPLTQAVVGNDHGGQLRDMEPKGGVGRGVVLNRPDEGDGASGREPGGGLGDLIVEGVDEGEPGFGFVDQEASESDAGEPGAIEPRIFENRDVELSKIGRAAGTDHQRGDASVSQAIDELSQPADLSALGDVAGQKGDRRRCLGHRPDTLPNQIGATDRRTAHCFRGAPYHTRSVASRGGREWEVPGRSNRRSPFV